jgi:hypothetical protein
MIAIDKSDPKARTPKTNNEFKPLRKARAVEVRKDIALDRLERLHFACHPKPHRDIDGLTHVYVIVVSFSRRW